MTNEFISVIIPTYNRYKVFRLCLDAIINQSIDTDNYEIVVVDDCSTDETEINCNSIANVQKNIIYIKNQTNQGLATTRNNGIKASTGSLLLFLDNDLIAHRDFLKYHLERHRQIKEKNIAVVSNITYEPEFLKDTNFGRYRQSRCIGYRSKRNMVNIDPEDLDGRFFAGGGSSCKREDAYEIGLFDESLKKYGSEDELFGHKLKSIGVKIVYESKARLIHYDQNIGPSYWKVKYIELGRYSMRALHGRNDKYIESAKMNYLLPINFKKDSMKTILIKCFLIFIFLGIIRKPIEYFVIKTDKYPLFSFNFLYQYISAAWIRYGFTSEKKIEEVKY